MIQNAEHAPQGYSEVNISEQGAYRYLHLGTPWIQGAMWLDKPYDLALEYVQRMTAWLLFIPDLERVSQYHTLHLGLGAASLTKFCYKKLHARTTCVELNPHVIRVCQQWFQLDPNNRKLQVIEGDAGVEIYAHDEWLGKITALHVDLYDSQAAAPVLDDEGFYTQCRKLLSPQGVLVVNLFGRSNEFEQSLDRIQKAFAGGAVWQFKPTREGNTIVMAFNEAPAVLANSQDLSLLSQRAREIEKQYDLPAKKWLKALMPT
jgi:spermidine synthase